VAELADDETVAAILDGIESVTDGSIEVAGLGRQIVLIAAIPSFDGEEYLADDLTPVRELARLALIETETESG
jgi:hypothetical protein